MKKFIIVDHSLINLDGHHYEYCISVAEAAQRLGYEPIILSNQAFSQELYPKNIRLIPAFKIDWFGNTTSTSNLPNRQGYLSKIVELVRVLTTNPLQNLSQYLETKQPKSKLALFLEKLEGSTSRLRNWFKQDLDLLKFIPFSNTLWGLFKIFWGLLRFGLGLLLAILSNLVKGIWTRPFDVKKPQSTPLSFTQTLFKTLEKIEVTPDDHVFIHTLGIEQIEDLFDFLKYCDHSCTPHYHVMQRRDVNEPLVINAAGIGLKASLNSFYQSKLWPEFITFYTDTEELTQQHNQLSPIQFITAPIPFRHDKLKECSRYRNKKESIHVVYLGNARPEKGYQYLPNLLAALWQDYIQPEKIKFTIQSNFNLTGGEPGILQARLELEGYPSSKVSLIKESLEPDAYYQLLGNADLLVIPYQAENYQVRSSGILVEALAAGKPVVVPANTWLSKQVDSDRASIYENPDEIASAVIRILEKFEQFSDAAYQYQFSWREKHSPDALVKCLIQEKSFDLSDNRITIESLQQEKKIAKILFIAEGDVLLEKSKNGQLCLQHLEYLFQCGYEIYGLFLLKNKVDGTAQIKEVIKPFSLIKTWIIQPNSSIPNVSEVNIQAYIRDIQENKTSLIRDLVEYSNFDISPSLSRFLQVEKIDVVFLNSIITYNLIEKLKLEKIPLFCEMTQFQSHYYALSNLRDVDENEFKLECKLLEKSTVILAHNSQEGDKIRELIHNPLVFSLPYKRALSSYRLLKKFSDEKANLIDFDSQLSSQDYCQIMNDIYVSILGNNSLSIDNFEQQKKVVILYPWGDILERKSGASQRTGLLIDYLKSQEYSIWVCTVGEEKKFWQDSIYYSSYEQKSSNFPFIKEVYSDAYRSWSTFLDSIFWQLENKLDQQFLDNNIDNEDTCENWLPWIYYQFRFDSGFIDWIEKITDWADVVILEYPFWAAIVGQICHRKNIKLLITAHDILAKQLNENSLIGKIALAEEINGLKKADYVIAVSEDDKIFFNQYGLKVQSIPHGINLDQIDSLKLKELSWTLPEKYLKRKFCLFVGSKHLPNIEVVELIHHLAKDNMSQFCDAGIDLDFLIVGNCCEPQELGNFVALGKVETDILSQLYQQAILVISPLLSGTGKSVKIIEAMSYGKVVLGTSVAFRGYRVESGVNCIICDNLIEYPKIIIALNEQPEKIEEIGKNARKFAEAYDYRCLYDSYKRLIEID